MQETRQLILEILKSRGHATVDDLAEALRLTPMTVRHHLAILEDRRLVDADVERGRVGRPHYVYRLTPTADELFPRAYHLLAERVLAKIKEQYGVAEARAILQAVAADLAAAHMDEVSDRPIHERMVRVGDIMAAEGFQVRLTNADQAVEVCNCAYRHVAAQHPEVCELDHALMEGILGQPLERVKHAPAGDDCCRFVVAESAPSETVDAVTSPC